MHIHRKEYTVPVVYPNGLTSNYYKISNHGNVYDKNGKKISTYVSIRPGRGIRRTVCLSEKGVSRKTPSKAGKWSKTFFISKIMWCSFKYIPKDGYEVHHKDGVSTNDYLWNLECLSHVYHQYKTSSHHKSEEQVRAEYEIIQKMTKPNWSLADIRKDVKLDENLLAGIYRIMNNVEYFNAKYNVDIKPYNKIKDNPFNEDDVHRICKIMSKPSWTYKDIFDEFGIKYDSKYWKTKFYDRLRHIYYGKRFTEISNLYKFGKLIK